MRASNACRQGMDIPVSFNCETLWQQLMGRAPALNGPSKYSFDQIREYGLISVAWNPGFKGCSTATRQLHLNMR